MYTIRKVFRFEAAHKLERAYSEACVDCIHGHSYIVEVFLQRKTLNRDGMVMDFGLLKSCIHGFIQEFDHALILSSETPKREIEALRQFNLSSRILLFAGNPTAEGMAHYFFFRFRTALTETDDKVILQKVRVHETETGWAEYEEG